MWLWRPNWIKQPSKETEDMVMEMPPENQPDGVFGKPMSTFIWRDMMVGLRRANLYPQSIVEEDVDSDDDEVCAEEEYEGCPTIVVTKEEKIQIKKALDIVFDYQGDGRSSWLQLFV